MIQAPKGTQDIFGADAFAWREIEKQIRETCENFCIDEIRTPTFEFTELFHKGVGETTDIVQKEMFTFEDRGGRSFSLKPEGTAGVVRSIIQNGMHSLPQPLKLYYLTNAFRGERPQKGRLVELHQFGIEFVGSYSPAIDAEVISVAYEVLSKLGLTIIDNKTKSDENIDRVELHINSIGDSSSRENYTKVLRKFIEDNRENVCGTCLERAVKNPLRALDCKVPSCQNIMKNAPSVQDSLSDESKKHFSDVQKYLTAMGIKFVVDDKIVRGLDYYTGTVFEFIAVPKKTVNPKESGYSGTVCGGGRYDNLIESLGGQKMGACGFGLGIERLLIMLGEQNKTPKYEKEVTLFIGSIGEEGSTLAQGIVYDLRKKGICAESDTIGRSVKAQLKYADKINAKYTLVIGDDEIKNKCGSVKRMSDGEKMDVTFDELLGFLNK